ncbi:hypothetical protein WN73_11810, partial [Bradyrhizobium sp. CCBAU 45394]|nr:hypothetical protein [Bradyrhizobium sp. CCBAU 45394]
LCRTPAATKHSLSAQVPSFTGKPIEGHIEHDDTCRKSRQASKRQRLEIHSCGLTPSIQSPYRLFTILERTHLRFCSPMLKHLVLVSLRMG